MIGVDVGGTFTDVVRVSGNEIQTTKVATDVHNTERAVLAGAEEVGVEDSTLFNHASTHGINAIITRRLPKIAFLTTLGHRDILDMGRTWRPLEGQLNPSWRRSFGDAGRPLVPRYLRRGVRERLTADGGVLIELDEDDVREQLQVLRRCQVEGIAICMINSYINRVHEERVRELVHEELGNVACSISSEVSPLAKEFARASTTTIDVFMKLIYDDYTKQLDTGLRDLGFSGDLNFADCASHLVRSDVAMQHPFQVVFSGPAAGTMASAHFGEMIGRQSLLCCDVGGTSCDISLVTDGAPFVNTTFELEHDLVVNALSNEVSSIGAGGGSLVISGQSGELQVGPGSAGADPGPACYDKGGTQPTMTDACLLMGVLDPSGFADGRMRLNSESARMAFQQLDSPLDFNQRVSYAFNLGVNNIAEGVMNVAISHGVDPRDYSLIAYGAAGPMLLPAVLETIHASEVIVPPHPGLFSALGLVSADIEYADSRSAYTMLTPENAEAVDKVYRSMEETLRERIQESDQDTVEIYRSFDARLVGQSWEVPFVPAPSGDITADSVSVMVANFHGSYAERSGNRFEQLPVQGVTYRVRAVVPSSKVEYPRLPTRGDTALKPRRTLDIRYLTDEPVEALEYARADLCSGDVVTGPAVIRESLSTTFMVPGQTAEIGDYGEIRIRKS